MPRELTPEEIQKRFAQKPVEPIAPIPKPGSGLRHTIDTAGVQGTPTAPDPPEPLPVMAAALDITVVGRPPAMDIRKAAEPGVFRLLPHGDVVPRGDNPRRIDEKSKAFQDLVASVRSAGVITPGIGRPHPDLPGKVELLAGHRRHRAAGVVGLAEFPIIVRDLDDRTALEVLVFENLDRENLTALEEARGVDLLLKSKHEPAEIAGRMGKTVAWVARRVQLLQLTAKWKEWAEEWNIGAAHLELIARLDRGLQEELFDHLTEDEYILNECFFEPGSIAKLRGRLQEELRELKHAPWALDNAVLSPKAGACSVCPKRSGCQPDLFSDPEDAGDRCLDPECWGEKMATFKKQREAELRKEHPNLVIIEGKDAPWNDRDKRALPSWKFTECKKSAEGAVPALIACGKGEGSLTYVKLDSSNGGGTREKAAKPAKGSAADKQAAASLDPKESAKLLKEKQEAHEQRRWAEVAKRLQRALDESNLPVAEDYRTAEGLLRLVRVFSADSTNNQALWVSERGRTWAKVAQPFGIETLEAVWDQVKPRIRTTLEIYKVSDIGPETHAAIEGVAMLLCRDLAVLKQEVDEAIPEPKSWEQLRKLSEAPTPAKEKPEQSRSAAKTAAGNPAKAAKKAAKKAAAPAKKKGTQAA